MNDIGKEFKLKLYINGKSITLKPFLKNFIKQIILSMVFNLKYMETPEKIELILKKSKKEERDG